MQKICVLALPDPSLSMVAKDNGVLRRKPNFKITTKRSEQYGSEYSAKPSFCISTKKRGLAEFGLAENGQIRAKIRRMNMDRSVKLQCVSILKELMNHPKGWIFNEPVDPVEWNIPDYFSIIKKPMDLGTIKHKLEDNLYLKPEEFADDIRLTYSNAMLYNHPEDRVHIIAKFFNDFFNKKLKSLIKTDQRAGNLNSKQSGSTVEKKSFPLDTKQNRAPMHEKLGNNIKSEKLMRSKIKISTDDARVEKGECSLKMSQNGSNVLMDKNVRNWRSNVIVTEKENCTSSSGFCPSNKDREAIGSTTTTCSSHNALICRCVVQNVSSSDVSSEHDRYGDSRPDYVKHPTAFHTRRLRPDCDGEIIRGPGVVALNEEISCAPDHLSTPITTTNIQISPKRALRIAMLKSRFATIIYKATHQGGNLDPLKMKQESERLQREQLEEKERIKNEMKATNVIECIRIKNEMKATNVIESKMQRQREREAARMALEKMKKTVEFNDDIDVLKELELLSRPSYM